MARPFQIGERVQLHAATDEWMQGDRYGEVVGYGRMREFTDASRPGTRVKAQPVLVKLDKSGRTRRFHPSNLFAINPEDRLTHRISSTGIPSENQVELHTWFERDRAHVELRWKDTGETVVEWWDEDVSQAIEDGFLRPKNYFGSAVEYARDHGLMR